MADHPSKGSPRLSSSPQQQGRDVPQKTDAPLETGGRASSSAGRRPATEPATEGSPSGRPIPCQPSRAPTQTQAKPPSAAAPLPGGQRERLLDFWIDPSNSDTSSSPSMAVSTIPSGSPSSSSRQRGAAPPSRPEQEKPSSDQGRPGRFPKLPRGELGAALSLVLARDLGEPSGSRGQQDQGTSRSQLTPVSAQQQQQQESVAFASQPRSGDQLESQLDQGGPLFTYSIGSVSASSVVSLDSPRVVAGSRVNATAQQQRPSTPRPAQRRDMSSISRTPPTPQPQQERASARRRDQCNSAGHKLIRSEWCGRESCVCQRGCSDSRCDKCYGSSSGNSSLPSLVSSLHASEEGPEGLEGRRNVEEWMRRHYRGPLTRGG